MNTPIKINVYQYKKRRSYRQKILRTFLVWLAVAIMVALLLYFFVIYPRMS